MKSSLIFLKSLSRSSSTPCTFRGISNGSGWSDNPLLTRHSGTTIWWWLMAENARTSSMFESQPWKVHLIIEIRAIESKLLKSQLNLKIWQMFQDVSCPRQGWLWWGLCLSISFHWENVRLQKAWKEADKETKRRIHGFEWKAHPGKN